MRVRVDFYSPPIYVDIDDEEEIQAFQDDPAQYLDVYVSDAESEWEWSVIE